MALPTVEYEPPTARTLLTTKAATARGFQPPVSLVVVRGGIAEVAPRSRERSAGRGSSLRLLRVSVTNSTS